VATSIAAATAGNEALGVMGTFGRLIRKAFKACDVRDLRKSMENLQADVLAHGLLDKTSLDRVKGSNNPTVDTVRFVVLRHCVLCLAQAARSRM
jgi:hypothetical protein